MTELKLWGIYDFEAKAWLGGNEGPKTFEDETLAKIAAQIFAGQLMLPVTRIRAKEYDPAPMRLRDSVDIKMSTAEALKKIEQEWIS